MVFSSVNLKAEDLLHTRPRSLSFDHLYSGLWTHAFRAQLRYTLKYSWTQPRTIHRTFFRDQILCWGTSQGDFVDFSG